MLQDSASPRAGQLNFDRLPRMLGLFGVLAGAVGATWLLLPHQAGADDALLAICSGVYALLGALVLTGGLPLTRRRLALALFLGSLSGGVAVYATGSPLSPFTLMVVWGAPLCSAILSARMAWLHLAFSSGAYALALSALPAQAGTHDVAAWLGVTATCLIVGLTLRTLTRSLRETREQAQAAASKLTQRARFGEIEAELGRRAVETREPLALAQHAVRLVAECIEVDFVGLGEIEPGQETLRVLAGSRNLSGTPQRVFPAGSGSLAHLALRSKGPVAIEDVDADDRIVVTPQMRNAGLQSAMACALRRPGQEIGVLTVFDVRVRDWRREEVDFLSVVAAVLATALERSAAEDAARARALHDALTGLANRELFRDRLAQALSRARRGAPRPAVLLLDLDQFKVINDSLGHHAGDALLQALAPRLVEHVRPHDTVARLGGDEFVVLCDGVESEEAALEIAERLSGAWQGPVTLPGGEVHISASVGVAFAGATSDPDELLRDADAAMYHAKRRGRGRVELFGAPLREQALRRLALEGDLRRALEAGDISVRFQPLVELDDGRIVACEALARWTRLGEGDVSPAEFVAVAEESRLIGALGRAVLHAACAEAAQWPAPVSVTVNLSGRQVADPDLAAQIAAALQASGLAPGRLCLEITESTLMEDAESPLHTLSALRAMGVRLALDDFGTGYSSLAYLRRFPLDMLKIDRSFVADVEHDPQSTALIEAVMTMAGSLGLNVVAEGIETEAQRERLLELGCRLGQGYLFAKPLTAAELRPRLVAATVAG